MTISLQLALVGPGTKGSYRNWAEISADSGDDVDSTPDTDTGLDDGTENGIDPNDLYTNHNDPLQDTADDDEDDNDYEDIFVHRSSILSRVNLQGATMNSTDGLMRDNLREDNLIPAVEPYTDMAGFDHVGAGGNEIMDAALMDVTGDDAIVDWVMIELHDAADPAIVIATSAAIVQKDGDIISPNGTEELSFDVPAGDYYVAVRHRNHLGCMTASPVTIGGANPANIDFTDANTATWGDHAQAQLADGSMALWGGAVNRKIIFQGAGNFPNEAFFEVLLNGNGQANYIYEGYNDCDVDMNCRTIFQGTDNEPNIPFFNVLLYPGNTNQISNFIIEEQIPQ